MWPFGGGSPLRAPKSKSFFISIAWYNTPFFSVPKKENTVLTEKKKPTRTCSPIKLYDILYDMHVSINSTCKTFFLASLKFPEYSQHCFSQKVLTTGRAPLAVWKYTFKTKLLFLFFEMYCFVFQAVSEVANRYIVCFLFLNYFFIQCIYKLILKNVYSNYSRLTIFAVLKTPFFTHTKIQPYLKQSRRHYFTPEVPATMHSFYFSNIDKTWDSL